MMRTRKAAPSSSFSSRERTSFLLSSHDDLREDTNYQRDLEDDWISLRLKAVDLCNKIIKKENMKSIVVFTGSGISVLSGIRTYRGDGGIWTEWKRKQRQQQRQRQRRKETQRQEEGAEENAQKVQQQRKNKEKEEEEEGEKKKVVDSSSDVRPRTTRRRISLSKRRRMMREAMMSKEEEGQDATSEDKKEEEEVIEQQDDDDDGYSWTQKTRTGRSLIPRHIWFPNVIHMFIAKMVERGLVACVITQNCDDLHRKSGIPPEKLIELHGNSFMEVCPKCKAEYHRDFIVAQPTLLDIKSRNSHKTGRFCSQCDTELEDTIVNFNEEIPEERLKRAFGVAEQCDLVITMGSSLKVEPANEIPLRAKKFVIINLQETPLDDHAELIMNGRAENVVSAMAQKEQLDLEPIPNYIFRIPLVVNVRPLTNMRQNGRSRKRAKTAVANDAPWVEIEVNNRDSTIEHFACKVVVLFPAIGADGSDGSSNSSSSRAARGRNTTRSKHEDSITLNLNCRFRNKIQIPSHFISEWSQKGPKNQEGEGVPIRLVVHFKMMSLPAHSRHRYSNICTVDHVVPLSLTTGEDGVETVTVLDRAATFDLSFDTKCYAPPVSSPTSILKPQPKRPRAHHDTASDEKQECLWTVSLFAEEIV